MRILKIFAWQRLPFLSPFHRDRHIFNILLRNRRAAKRAHGKRHQLHGIVVGRRPVRADFSADGTSVNHRPFPVFSHPYADRLHPPMAAGFPVTRAVVQMNAVQAVRTVVSVAAACSCRDYRPAADLAGEGVRTWMCTEIPPVIFSFFIFSVHNNNLPNRRVRPSSW